MIVFQSFCFKHEAAIYWLIVICTWNFQDFFTIYLDLSKVCNLIDQISVQWLYSGFLFVFFGPKVPEKDHGNFEHLFFNLLVTLLLF